MKILLELKRADLVEAFKGRYGLNRIPREADLIGLCALLLQDSIAPWVEEYRSVVGKEIDQQAEQALLATEY